MNNKPEEETISLEPDAPFHRYYDWLPYTSFRIKRMLEEIGCRAENLYQGYKSNRRPGYCEIYRIVRIEDGAVIHPGINRYSLQKFFASQGLALEDEKSMTGTPSARNQGAEAFVRAVEYIKTHQK